MKSNKKKVKVKAIYKKLFKLSQALRKQLILHPT